MTRDSIVETNTRTLIRETRPRSSAGSALCVRYINTAIKRRRVFGISARADWLLITNARRYCGVISGHVLERGLSALTNDEVSIGFSPDARAGAILPARESGV